MNSTRKCKSAMITVELAVSLVLIVVVLFVAIGMFGDNVKTMVTSSNFNNLMEDNSQRTFFSNFKRDYKDSQIQVQVMGEQGLELLRQKANNNALTVIDKILNTNNPPKDAKTSDVDTVAYLGLVITAIVGDSQICGKMEKPSKEKCNQIGLPVKYSLDLKDTSSVKIGRYTFKGSSVSMSAMNLADKDQTEQVYTVIGSLTNSYNGLIDNSLSLFNTSETFSTGLAATSSFESKLLAFLVDKPNAIQVQAENEYSTQSLLDSLEEAKKHCNGMRDFWSWLGGVSNDVLGTDFGTPCAAGGVTQKDINTIKSIMLDPLTVSTIGKYVKEAELIAKTGASSTANTSGSTTGGGSGGGGGGGSCGGLDKQNSLDCTKNYYQSNLKIEKTIYSARVNKLVKYNIPVDKTFTMGYKELDSTSNMLAILQQYEVCSVDSQEGGSCSGGGGGGSRVVTTTSSSSSSTTGAAKFQCYDVATDDVSDCSLEKDLIYRPTATTTTYGDEPVYAVTIDSEKYLIKQSTLEDPFTTNDARLTGVASSSLRAAITAYYAKMLDTIWNQNDRILPYLKKDQITRIKDKPRETSCKLYISTLSKIASIIGLVEYRDTFDYYYNSNMCNPDVAIVEAEDESEPVVKNEPINNATSATGQMQ